MDMEYDFLNGVGMGVTLVMTLIYLAVAVLMLVCMWKIFTMAGEPGWGSIIPLYNTYLFIKISMGNGWLFLLMFVPIANFIIGILASVGLAKAFGKGTGFGIGLIFLPVVFLPILAFGDSTYYGVQR